jgi:endonuclease/exonuclease/phosphatase family metal-dependent hydrolase
MRVKNLTLVLVAAWLACPILLCADDDAKLDPVTAVEQWGRSLASVFYIAEASEPVEELISPTLKVMSLNLAHGRKEAMSQLLQRGKTTRTNILEAAELLERNAAHIVALQEADGPSRWSGKFDHVALLAEAANYPYTLSTYHAKTWLYSYGTAILSRVALVDTVQHTFEPSPPTMNKGFTLAKIAWRPQAEADEKLLVDIVSVHLDFSRKKVRERQIDEMTKVLKDRIGPMIILDDFNSEWFSDEAVVREIAERFEHSFPIAVHQKTWKMLPSSHQNSFIIRLRVHYYSTYIDLLSILLSILKF